MPGSTPAGLHTCQTPHRSSNLTLYWHTSRHQQANDALSKLRNSDKDAISDLLYFHDSLDAVKHPLRYPSRLNYTIYRPISDLGRAVEGEPIWSAPWLCSVPKRFTLQPTNRSSVPTPQRMLSYAYIRRATSRVEPHRNLVNTWQRLKLTRIHWPLVSEITGKLVRFYFPCYYGVH